MYRLVLNFNLNLNIIIPTGKHQDCNLNTELPANTPTLGGLGGDFEYGDVHFLPEADMGIRSTEVRHRGLHL